MSKPLFEFVKVAAGTAFPFESGRYSGYNSAFGPNETEANDWHKGEVSKIVDWFILRPAESPDAGREGELKELRQWKERTTYMMDKRDLQAIGREIGVDVADTISDKVLPWIRAMKASITPADPGSQVEEGKFAEWTSDEQWEYQPHAKVWVKYELEKQSDGMYESKIYAEATTADLITLYKQSL